MKLKTLLMKLDRFFAWSLIAIMLIFFISGYGMTKGVISPEFSKLLHDTILPIPGMFAFAFHSAYGVHISLKRWRVWGRAWLVILIVYVVLLVAGTAVFQFAVRPIAGSSEPATIEL